DNCGNESRGRHGTGCHREPPTVGEQAPERGATCCVAPDPQRPPDTPHGGDLAGADRAGCGLDYYRESAPHQAGYRGYFAPWLVGDDVGTPKTTAIGCKRHQRRPRLRL